MMGAKGAQLGAGNAAEKLRLTRAMPNLSLTAPLPAEGAPAVAVSRVGPPARPSTPRRGYRISTFMTDEAGARLLKLVAHFKATKGRRHGAPDVLERALLALERELGL